MLFALREAASWFFKIDDIKKDVRKLRGLVVDMEAEVRLLQSLLSQNLKLATDRSGVDAITENVAAANRPAPIAAQKEKAPEAAPSFKFPVSH